MSVSGMLREGDYAAGLPPHTGGVSRDGSRTSLSGRNPARLPRYGLNADSGPRQLAPFSSESGAFCCTGGMTADRILLDGDRVRAFHDAFDKRRDYIRAEGIDRLVGGEESVPLPGCPECGTPAENVASAEYETVLETDVDPCGHRFRTPLPFVVVTRNEQGQAIAFEEWHL